MKTRELLLATLLGVAIAADRIARAIERIADKMEKCP